MRNYFPLLVAAAMLAAAPAHAQTCTPFTDVAASDPFCTNIQWMFNRGITLGCTATTYCPTQFVRRDQMAAFMNRLGNVTFQQGGNAFAATAVLGTTDSRPLEVMVGNQRAMRIERTNIGAFDSVNIIAGASTNRIGITCTGVFCSALDPVIGSAIAGGGTPSVFPLDANLISDSFGFIGGGSSNTVGNDDSDEGNATHGTVAGGLFNRAVAARATVGGGGFNRAGGQDSVIPGGRDNRTDGDFALAAGRRAEAFADGCFVWSDSSAGTTACNTANLFLARATGGFALRTNTALTSGCAIAAGGGAWSCSSARDLKDDFSAVDPEDVLDRVASLPISTWRYRDEASRARHLGPTAEDFHQAFGLGDSSREIGLIDGQGVALAAIQGLNAKLEAQARVLDDQRQAIAALQRELAALRTRTR